MPRRYGSPSQSIVQALYAHGSRMSRRELREVLSRAGEPRWVTEQGIRRMSGCVRTLTLNGSLIVVSPRGDLELTDLGRDVARGARPLRRKAS
jgi:hypothetical protein